MLDRLGIGGGGADSVAEERAGMTGGPLVKAVVTGGCSDGTAFGLGGMYGASDSPSHAATFEAAAVGVVSTAFSRRGIGTRATMAASGRGASAGRPVGFPAVSGRGAGTGTFVVAAALGAGTPVEFPTALGLGAGTGAAAAGLSAEDELLGGRTPTGRLAGRGGGGPRLVKPDGRAGGKPVGGGIDTVCASSD